MLILQAIYVSRWLFLFYNSKVKKLNIDTTDSEMTFQVFGINTPLKDYQLCILVNEFFNLETRLLTAHNFESDCSVFGDEIDELKVILFQNKGVGALGVFPKLNAFEYLIVVSSQEKKVEDIMTSFDRNDEILYITKIENKHLNAKDNKSFNQLLGLL